MNKPLQISLLLNAALLVCIIFLFFKRPPLTPPAALAPVAATVAPAPPASPPPSAPPAPPAPPRWSQLYSPDYHNYVKNLRAVGCPEPSVRAIVTADVDSVYQIIAGRLEQALVALAQAPLTSQLKSDAAAQKLRAALQQIPTAEEAKIADLLGLKPVSAAPGSANPVPLPLVMQEIDMSALHLTPEQTQEVASVKQDFLKQTGGANPAPNDPAAQARWRTAQTDADNMLMVYLGNDNYSQYEVAAHQRMLEGIEAARH